MVINILMDEQRSSVTTGIVVQSQSEASHIYKTNLESLNNHNEIFHLFNAQYINLEKHTTVISM